MGAGLQPDAIVDGAAHGLGPGGLQGGEGPGVQAPAEAVQGLACLRAQVLLQRVLGRVLQAQGRESTPQGYHTGYWGYHTG